MSVNVDLFPEIELGNIVSCRQDWAYASACCWTAATAQYAGARVRHQNTVYGQVR